MNKLTKKIVAILTTVTCAVFVMGPGSADALTAAELQAMIDSLLAQIATLQSQLTQVGGGTTVSGCAITSFTRNLTIGSSGNDVKCLQIILNSDAATKVAATGAGSPGAETTTFGPLTKAAVIKFQDKYASEVLTPLGLTAGTGYVGAKSIIKLNTMIGSVPSTPTTPITPVTTTVNVSLASDSPAATQVALNSQDMTFAKYAVTGGTTGVTINQVIVSRGGVSADADISSIKLYDGATQLGSTQALNTLTHKVTFSSLSWTVPAGQVKYLTIKGSVAASGTATVGDSIQLGIVSASDITSSVALGGTFPIWGSAKTIAGISVGALNVDKQASPATTTILSGAVQQEVAAWRFAASGTEGFTVNSIAITQVGSGTRSDLSNLKLMVNGVQIGSTVASLDNQNKATFDLSAAPLAINSSASKVVTASADVAGGINTARTVIFEITQATDVTAFGSNSGGATTITYNTGTTYTRQTGNTMTIGQGTLTVALDSALNPSAQTYVKGTTNRSMTALKFTTGSTEGVRVTKLVLTLGGTTPAATDISNVTLWDGSVQIAGPASVIGSSVTFGANTVGWDATGLFDVAKSSVKTIVVKADIPNGANASHTVSLSLAANTDLWVDGLSSMYDLAQSSNVVSATGNAHSIGSFGSLAVSLSSSAPTAQTYVIGGTEKEFARFDLTAGSGEDMIVSSITVDIQSNGIAATSGAKLINMKLVKMDGTQFGNTVASPVATASFSGNTLTIPASQTVTLKIIADVPTTSYPSPNASTSIAGVTTAIANALETTGASSQQSITETGGAAGNAIIIGAGGLTVAVSPTPGDQTLIIGASTVPVAAFALTAGTAEDVRVTYLKIWNSASTVESSTTDLSNIALYNAAGTRLTTLKSLTAGTGILHYVVFNASDFLNSTGIDIAKGQQTTLTVKADLPSTGIATHKVALGFADANDIVTTGLSSNTEIAESMTTGPLTATGVNHDTGYTANNLYEVTLSAKGTLAMNNSAAKPSSSIVAVGQQGVGGLSGVVFQMVDFKADLENIYVKSVEVGRIGGADADFASITLWDGTTQLGSAQTLTNASTTFNFPTASYWLLTKGVTKTLTIKADLNGIAPTSGYGATTGNAPLLQLDNVTVQGVSSGSTAITSATELAGNVQYIRQSKPVLASASLPNTSLGAGEKVLYRWTATADSKGDIGWEKVVIALTGSVTYPSAGTNMAHTVGCVSSSGTCTTKTDGVYMSTGTDDGAVALIATSSMKIYDVATNEQVTASTTATGLTVAQASGVANVSFVAASEQVIPAGQTKTYELRGTILTGGLAGDSISAKIADANNSPQAGAAYATVAGGTASFVWTDRSGNAATHSAASTDWTHDYKVSGVPTSPLTLSK
jgi:hypothetical protein